MSVLHPRWFYPPLSGSLIPFWLSLQLLLPILRLRKDFPFEVIDTHFGFPEGIAGLFLSLATNVPFTMTLRGNEPKHSRSKLTRFCMTWALRRAGRVFTVSERLRQFAIGLGAEPSRVKTIPNGISNEVFTLRDRTACRLKHGLPADRPVILSAGALVERKGHHRVIEALKSLRDEGATAELVVAGGPGPEGSYEMRLRKLVSVLGLEGSVHFVGAVNPRVMAELMTAADVLSLASTNEGWPNVVHEALACGTPVVATDVGAVPEMLEGGRNGIIVRPGNQQRLKEAIEEALCRKWDRSAISAWGQARDWRRVAEEVVDEMQTLLATQNG
jgi:glycosyltransferase involved in cell wall biosynthesis